MLEILHVYIAIICIIESQRFIHGSNKGASLDLSMKN